MSCRLPQAYNRVCNVSASCVQCYGSASCHLSPRARRELSHFLALTGVCNCSLQTRRRGECYQDMAIRTCPDLKLGCTQKEHPLNRKP